MTERKKGQKGKKNDLQNTTQKAKYTAKFRYSIYIYIVALFYVIVHLYCTFITCLSISRFHMK